MNIHINIINIMPNHKYKTSYGIALCRYNKNNNLQSEIIMVKKRYTYHYFSFIFGHYKKYNNKQIKYLFNHMTFDEKVTILSMKFSNMWYRIWLYDPECNMSDIDNKSTYNSQYNHIKCYFSKKSKFDTIFLRDGGKRLKRLIDDSDNSVTPWEMPKGGINEGETQIDCARREFEEEACITPDNYTMMWNVDPIIVSHTDCDVIYRSVYYLAYINNDSDWKPKVKFDTNTQLTEIEQVRWISLSEIKFLNLSDVVKNRLIKNYKKTINIFKKHIKSQYYNQKLKRIM